jgi:curved DNA-binding protein CbpA
MSAQTATYSATYYEILGVSRRERPDGVRTAYRRLAQRYHPDKMPDDQRAEQVMAALNEAYAVLSDPQQRARYDEAIDEARRAQQHARQRAQENFVEQLEDPGASWPWYLLFATVTFCAAAIGISVYVNYVPGASVPQVIVRK